jgi:phosphatidylglycerophosphate synthase
VPAILAGWGLVAALAVQSASVLDGADGEIARVAHRGSRFGAFLDPMLDRVVDGLVFSAAGLYLAVQVGGGVAAGLLGALATVGHLLVSYSTSRAALDLGHRYEGRLLASGRGRDLRLLILSAGLAGSAGAAWALPVALGVVAALTWWIIAVRMVRSWHASRLEWADVDVVIVDFDGTIADSMGQLTELAVKVICEELGLGVDDARSRYLASTGSDFTTQLEEIDPAGRPARTRPRTGLRPPSRTSWRAWMLFRICPRSSTSFAPSASTSASAVRPDGNWLSSGSTATVSKSTSALSTGGHRGMTRQRRCDLCSTGRGFQPTAAWSWVTPAATVSWRPRSGCASGGCYAAERRTSRVQG